MFFTLSKFLWFVANPMNLLLIAICLIAVLCWARWWRWARIVASLTALTALLVTVVPVGGPVIQALENRFPANPALPDRVDGVVVLGGAIRPYLRQARGRPQLNDAVERLTATVRLARRYPEARIIFSGGAGDVFLPDFKEATHAPGVFADMGLDPGRIIYESQARNTAENARFTFELAGPKPGETWVLVTSAFHMPRAVGTYRQAGWRVIAYPVDFSTPGDRAFELRFNFSSGLGSLTRALHECLGLFFYWVTDRSDALFPGPDG